MKRHRSTETKAPAGEVSDRSPRRRRRRAAAIVVFAALCGVAGGAVGSRLRSPADAARDRAAPRPSRITVPVERSELVAKLVIAATVEYATPYAVTLAGSVGSEGATNQLVTRVPAVGTPINEGDVLMEVVGRPVIVLSGAIPTYRTIAPGATGPDVAQLEQALERLGFSPGTVDDVYDTATESAVQAMYAAKGLAAIGPTSAEQDRLTSLDEAVVAAESQLRTAQKALDDAGKPPQSSELLQLQQAVTAAGEQLAQAQRDAVRDNASADRALVQAQQDLVRAQSARDAAAMVLAKAITDVSPELADQQAALAEAEQALAQAQVAVADRTDSRAKMAEAAAIAISSAQRGKDAAEAALRDGTKSPDTTNEQQALADALTSLAGANAARDKAENEIGITVPAGEVVFAPTLPSNVTNVAAVVGSPAVGVMATLSSSSSRVVGSVSAADGALVKAGARAVVDLRDYAIELPATITSVGPPAPEPTVAGDGSGSTGPATDRPQVVADTDQHDELSSYVGASVRLVIDIAATGGKVLVVPIAAVSVGGDGASRVEVERTAATATDDATTDLVPVEVGLTADGLVEVRSPALHEGDRVVVGQAAASPIPISSAPTP